MTPRSGRDRNQDLNTTRGDNSNYCCINMQESLIMMNRRYLSWPQQRFKYIGFPPKYSKESQGIVCQININTKASSFRLVVSSLVTPWPLNIECGPTLWVWSFKRHCNLFGIMSSYMYEHEWELLTSGSLDFIQNVKFPLLMTILKIIRKSFYVHRENERNR